jgi:hypothetical protein
VRVEVELSLFELVPQILVSDSLGQILLETGDNRLQDLGSSSRVADLLLVYRPHVPLSRHDRRERSPRQS